MANLFVDVPTIVQQMLDKHKSVTQVTLSPDQTDDDFVIKCWSYATAISAWYAQLQRLSNDSFAFSASESALENMIRARGLSSRSQPGPAHMQIQFSFSGPAAIPATKTQVQRNSDGAIYTVIQAGSGDVGSPATLYVEAAVAGNAGNLDQLNQPFTLITPITGVSNSCQNVSLGTDGKDIESQTSMANRVLENDQDENSGGNVTAYEDWAYAASDQVVSATALRRLRGPDTVDVVITSGTTDIAGAVQSGQSVVRTPSAALVSEVAAYIQNLNPITDDVLVYGPTTIPLNVTFNYSLYTETVANRAYVNSVITQTISIYLYSANPTDVLTPSAIERLVDQAIGDQISQRSCQALGGGTNSFTVPNANIIVPGTITLGTLS